MEKPIGVYCLRIWCRRNALDSRDFWHVGGYYFLFTIETIAFTDLLYHNAFFLFVGVVVSGVTNRRFGTEDHSAIVFDEIVGFLIVMISIPKKNYFILAGFFLFRIFDIWKPWPIRWLEKNTKGGWGVMVDDIAAAFYAWIILMIGVYFF